MEQEKGKQEQGGQKQLSKAVLNQELETKTLKLVVVTNKEEPSPTSLVEEQVEKKLDFSVWPEKDLQEKLSVDEPRDVEKRQNLSLTLFTILGQDN